MNAPPAHLAPYHLELLRLGRLAGEEAERARVHLGSCGVCRRLDERLHSYRQHFEVEVLPRTRARLLERATARERPAPWRRRALLALPALAAAAIVVLVAMRSTPAPQAPAASVYLGIKGGASFRVFQETGGQTVAVGPGTVLHAGNAIRFLVSSAYPYVMIAGVDRAAGTQLYVPFRGRESLRVEPGRQVLPPGSSIVLDRAIGPERIFALFSRRPLDAAVVTAALRTVARQGDASVRSTDRLPIEVDDQASLLLEKAAARP
jgi:hypothetical protein